MDRLVLTTEQQTKVDAWLADKATDTLNPMSADVPGTNLVFDDHVEVASSWKCICFGGGNDAVYAYIPDWDLFFSIDLVDAVTDRAGPNGQTMPIIDPVQAEARTAAKAAAANPKQAAHAEKVERRELKQLLKDAIARLPHAEQKHAREVLRAHGVLGKDD
jgi:hypothetical protein